MLHRFHAWMLIALAATAPVVADEVDTVDSNSASDNAARLEVEWIPAGSPDSVARRIELTYRFHNHGTAILALIDRGSLDEPGRLSPHEIPGEEGLTLSVEALPLSDPAPTYPVTPLARLVAPGETVEGVVRLRVPETSPVVDGDGAQRRVQNRRLRFCIGYAPFSERGFVAEGDDWIPTETTIRKHQRQLCTPWHELEPPGT